MCKHHKISGRPTICAHRMPRYAGVRGGFCRNLPDIFAAFSRLPMVTAGMLAVMGAGMT
ncbi:MAG TPA: hypothetical protein VEZ52_11930 [Desulfovibrio sp.]|uniref:hypothetical protein n=1 Tax=Desulfovibrio sp. TaxID=885 RepID=UPI002D282A3B|nr:hypothetical protein [Desulfovibrio sp.]HZF62314.1 hypothetical protein [Desulfovibrio sp.]